MAANSRKLQQWQEIATIAAAAAAAAAAATEAAAAIEAEAAEVEYQHSTFSMYIAR